MTSPRVFSINDLEYTVRPQFDPQGDEGREFHVLAKGNLTATLLRFKAGETVPMHTHSKDAKILVLSGESHIEYADGQKFTLQPGLFYDCGSMGPNYFHAFTEDTIMLALQSPEDTMIRAES